MLVYVHCNPITYFDAYGLGAAPVLNTAPAPALHVITGGGQSAAPAPARGISSFFRGAGLFLTALFTPTTCEAPGLTDQQWTIILDEEYGSHAGTPGEGFAGTTAGAPAGSVDEKKDATPATPPPAEKATQQAADLNAQNADNATDNSTSSSSSETSQQSSATVQSETDSATDYSNVPDHPSVGPGKDRACLGDGHNHARPR